MTAPDAQLQEICLEACCQTHYRPHRLRLPLNGKRTLVNMNHLQTIRWPLWGLRQLWPTLPYECALARLGTDLPLHGDRHMRGEEIIVNPTSYTPGLPAVEYRCSSCRRRGLDGLRSHTRRPDVASDPNQLSSCPEIENTYTRPEP